MDVVHHLGSFGGNALGYVLPFVFVLSIVVFFHELGHFLVGRLCGVRVLTFSLGFGPEVLGFNDRHGTRWRLAAIPLGGYVKFFGDANAASAPDFEGQLSMSPEDRRVSFFHKPVWQRAAVVAAGPIANFILAVVIFGGLYTLYGKQIVVPRVDAIEAGSAAEQAGFKTGDIVVSIDGEPVAGFADLQRTVSTSAGRALAVVVERSGARTALTATPQLKEQADGFGGKVRTGVLGIKGSPRAEDVRVERYDPITGLWMGTQETGYIIGRTFSFLGGLVAGRERADELGGPIRIAQVSEQVAGSSGLLGLITLSAMLSVSIGMLNLFPIPLLDGGHLVFYAFEAVRGRPLGENAQEMLFRFGLAAVAMLMLFATWNDLSRVFSG